MKKGIRNPETFDIDSLPIGIEELAREEGEKKEKERIALSMLEDNLPISKIAQYTKLTEKEIDDLKKQTSNGR